MLINVEQSAIFYLGRVRDYGSQDIQDSFELIVNDISIHRMEIGIFIDGVHIIKQNHICLHIDSFEGKC